MAIRATMLRPSQKAEKLPATSPERMFSEAPPSLDAVTTSLVWVDSVEVNTLTSSGMTAPASVPQEMMADSFHHSVSLPPRFGIMSFETTKVRIIETMEVIQTSEVRGASKFMWSELLYLPLANMSFAKKETALDTSIMMRITKIQTSSCTCTVGSFTASRMKVIRATPVTP